MPCMSCHHDASDVDQIYIKTTEQKAINYMAARWVKTATYA